MTAGSAATAETLAPQLATKLDARLRLALRGRLLGKAAKPPKLRAGPPSGGPDLSVLALRKTDLVGKATVNKAYVGDPAAISDYSVFMLPAGQFGALDQEIEWYPAANEASFFADFENAAALAAKGSTALDLGSLGDGVQGQRDGGVVAQHGARCLLQRQSGRVHLPGRTGLDRHRRRDGHRPDRREPDRLGRAG